MEAEYLWAFRVAEQDWSFRSCDDINQGLIEKNSFGVSNVNMSTTGYVLGYYPLIRLLTFRSKFDINLLFCFRLQY